MQASDYFKEHDRLHRLGSSQAEIIFFTVEISIQE